MKVVLVKVIFSYNHLVAMAALAILEIVAVVVWLIALGSNVLLTKQN